MIVFQLPVSVDVNCLCLYIINTSNILFYPLSIVSVIFFFNLILMFVLMKHISISLVNL